MNRAAAGLGVACLVLGCDVPPEKPPTAAPAVEPSPLPDPPRLREVFESLPDGGPVELRVLDRNDEAWAERWRLVASARSSIDVTTFILEDDVFGVSLLGHLLERARAGVRIRLLVDAYGTDVSGLLRGNPYLHVLPAEPNAEVRAYRPLHERYLQGLLRLSPSVAFASQHDKIVVVDGERTIVGGRNIGAEYYAHPDEIPHTFSDVDVAVDGEPLARAASAAFGAEHTGPQSRVVDRAEGDLERLRADLQLAFRAMEAWLGEADLPSDLVRRSAEGERDWVEELRRHPSLRGALERPRPKPVVAEARLLDSTRRFGRADDPVTQRLFALVGAASERIFGVTPYLVLTAKGRETLEEAGRRGVRTTLLTNSPVSSDNALSQAFFMEQWPEILARVPGLRLYVGGTPRTVHGKIATFDDVLSLVSTYNLDPTSMMMHSEVAVAVWSREFADEVTAAARKRIEAGPPLVYQYRIRRDAGGEPVRDENGEPVVAFGPKDHASPAEWRSVQALWTLLRATTTVPGLSAFL